MSKINRIKTITDLYFVAIVPPEPLFSTVQEMKQTACDRFNSCAALNSPPHITLHMPFRWKRKKESTLHQFFDDFKPEVEPFRIQVDGIDHFGNRVIFLSIADNIILRQFQGRLATTMKRHLNLFNVNYKDQPFHPHITLAFRDLKKQYFDEAINHYRSLDYSDGFLCDQFCLLKHDGNNWQIFKEYQY